MPRDRQESVILLILNFWAAFGITDYGILLDHLLWSTLEGTSFWLFQLYFKGKFHNMGGGLWLGFSGSSRLHLITHF